MENKKSVFEVLNAIDVSAHVEKKNGLTYLSWAWAWSIVKQNFPNATYDVVKDEKGNIYHTDGRTCWVETSMTIEGITHTEWLPVMDYRNASISADKVTSFDVNKSIQRSLTKAAARHGLGLYIYAGEDLPEEPKAAPKSSPKKQAPAKPAATGKHELTYYQDTDTETAINELWVCNTIEELLDVWNRFKAAHPDRCYEGSAFQKEATNRRKEIEAMHQYDEPIGNNLSLF